MSVKRLIDTGFWQDPKIIDTFSPEDKYFYLYLLTNSYNSICGVARMSFKTIAYELGYSTDAVKVLIDRFINKYGAIDYDNATSEIIVINWYKYNWTTSPKLIASVNKSIKDVKSVKFRTYLNNIMDQLESGNGIDTVSIPYQYLTISNTISNTIIEDRVYKGKKQNTKEVKDIISYLNQVTGKRYSDTSKDTIKLINARLKEKYTIEDFKAVIDYKNQEWNNNSEMAKYLRPATLFGNKFRTYLEDSKQPKAKNNNMPDWYEDYKTREVDTYDYELDTSLTNDFLKGE